MSERIRRQGQPEICLLSLEALLYITYLIMDIFFAYDDAVLSVSYVIKFTAIALIFIYSFARLFLYGPEPVGITACIAFMFTVSADVFLLFFDDGYQIGILLFCAVQLMYYIRIQLERKRTVRSVTRLMISITARIVLLSVMVLAGVSVKAGTGFDSTVTALAAVYFSNLVANIAEGFACLDRDRYLFPQGMILLMLCDICVGLNNLGIFGRGSAMYVIIFAGMWFFYIPSQVCIALSINRQGEGHDREQKT